MLSAGTLQPTILEQVFDLSIDLSLQQLLSLSWDPFSDVLVAEKCFVSQPLLALEVVDYDRCS